MTAPLPSPPYRPPFRALLGLRDGDDPELWSRIRAAQLRAGQERALLLLAAHLTGVALVVMMLDPLVPVAWLVPWTVATTLAAIVTTVRRQRAPRQNRSYADLPAMRAPLVEGLVLGLLWGAVPLMFGPFVNVATALALHIVIAVLVAAAALAMVSLLAGALAFVALTALSAAIALLLADSPVAAAADLLFATLLGIATFDRARALALLHAARVALTERDGTIGLLLRDFDESAADWLWQTDAARRIVEPSARFAAACGRDAAQIAGRPLLEVLAGPGWDTGRVAPVLRELATRLQNRESIRDLDLPIVVDGQQRWWRIAASPRRDADGHFGGFRGVASDITEQRASADKIARMARFDMLTDLPNRLYVNEALTAALARAEQQRSRCAFMMIDLDRFKAVNDTLGHPIGDRLLGRVSERLATLVGEGETVGRLGGDEFAVVVPDAGDPLRVEQLAHTIIDTLSRPYEVDQHTLYIGASVGVATSPRDGRSAETLIRSADLALYRSKDQGGGVFHAYEPQLHAEAEERRVLELALRKALENDELYLDYQPVVDARTGTLRAFEALLRWRHPAFGQIPPSKFVPIAEEARLIAPIGEWVVRTACAEAAGWPDPIRVAVNVSPEQLHNPQFVAIVADALTTSGLAARRLELEVTESVFLREGTGATRVLRDILDLGVGLSLDDFGTGYSSLGYLSSTRFSSIKIDRSFVQTAATGRAEAIAIIRAVVAMADSLDMTTTAEGVETEAELRMVQELGCRSIQGYYFGRPLPVADARALAGRSLHTRAA
ncbi:diguanylate cyclase (GGDEF)-like protein/PAS domain S-box-containing protein [Sphingomonas sp. BE138]|uniref:putative bifunctional diguanylate cyclase/phosphodiesterase n=1 Tax=Sphingomonas sp. BE138 TaxID=2817845 RepID=UPI002861B7DD|nr:EAL domain-containing protein [Sphingomonas sp. BE138]MDR6788632.1 diguanylate cyclase (GGDEF)-like protein/PAS domain S-box-containing protein [Sphingomonas sp. BE138]